MAVKTVFDKQEDIPQEMREHYVEQKDSKGVAKFYLTLDGPVDALPATKSLRDEAGSYRIQLRDVTEKYGKIKAFEGMDPAEVQAKLDRISELEAANGGKLNDAEIDKIVEGRIKTKISPLERENTQLKTKVTELEGRIGEYSAKEQKRMITDEVRAAATKLKVLPEAVEDAIMYAERVMEISETGVVSVKDKVGFTPGLDVASWLSDMQTKRPHWWGPSLGGGARGGAGGAGVGGPNPWSHEGWNVSEQGRIYKLDPKRAETLAVNAGTKLGGGRPAPKK